MSDPTADPYTIRDIMAGGAAILTGLVAWVGKIQVARIDKLEGKAVPSKEEHEAHEKQDRETFIKLFEGQAEIKKEIATGFSNLSATINAIHVETLKELAKKEDKHGSFYPLDR